MWFFFSFFFFSIQLVFLSVCLCSLDWYSDPPKPIFETLSKSPINSSCQIVKSHRE